MAERSTWFVDVILPLSLPNLYTYRVPYELNDAIKAGQRVVVQFGKSKLYTALVRNIHSAPPKQYEAKYLHSILDDKPIVNERQLQLWDWMASYYMCNIGEVMNAALPSGFKLSSETKIILDPESDPAIDGAQKINYENLTDKEYLIVEALELRSIITLNEAAEILEQKTVYPVIKSLLGKRVVIVQEELKERYKPRVQAFVRLNDAMGNESKLKEVLDKLEKKAGKQMEVMLAYIKLSRLYEKDQSTEWVKKSDLLKVVEGTESALKALVKKNIFDLQEFEVGRLINNKSNGQPQKKLNDEQEEGLFKIKKHFETKDVVLLHGVTSSGKTEIYIKLIEETLKQGKQVLYLLPEIALTTQIINRLQNVFDDKVGVYHSKFNENERVEIWNKVLGGTGDEGRGAREETQREESHRSETGKRPSSPAPRPLSLILGARSSLFLPFSNLGLIIVDEEHDTSYKQFDPAPRYNARDSAIFLAQVHKTKVLLGSATPSLESYYNTQTGKYGLVELFQRHGGVQMPEIQLVDIKEATRKKMMKSHFSPQLLEGVEFALKNKEQVILFQNRRGFSPVIECNACAWTPQCKNCDVSLTYHKTGNQLRCHYCGYNISVPAKCEACGDTNLKTKGFGTEKIEEELGIYFPAARVSRMDLDTTRTKYAHRQIISDFEDRNIDILVGTQMVTKGLDFDNVALVGILNADSMLNFPDFRSFERSYQLMAQVSGRAGRKDKRGKVIIQTYNPGHAVINDVVNNNYLSMYTSQLLDRKNFNYPPFYRLIEITLKFKDMDVLNEGAKFVAGKLREQLGSRVLGPEFPLVARVRNEYLKAIMIKVERETSITSAKKIINEVFVDFKNQPAFKQVKLHVDVDPL
ncbi:MAG: primosomal protein N' [Bacteroidetes bacterium]|nr:primosomal protein N' [Bacteroidota bacterium]